jgi:hypothetical protein
VKRHTARILALAAVFLALTSGCASSRIDCCAECPPEIQTVTIEKRVAVPAPLIRIGDPPPITSAWSGPDAAADPDGWLEAVFADLTAWVNAYFSLVDRVEVSNTSRPDP